MDKTAVVLMNLGGPPDSAAIYPFLVNFFSDPRIIPAPPFLRYLIARGVAWQRSRGPARRAYGHLGGGSPLLENTLRQQEALERRLREVNPFVKVFVSMRYWHPRASQVAEQVREYGATRVILLPLYPQFSTVTTLSSFDEWDRICAEKKISIPTQKICCYPEMEGFIKASVKLIRDVLQKSPPKTRLLFSAHGLPEKILGEGDPYRLQCERTARKIARRLDLKDAEWQLCYQSRVGPLKWIGPSTEEALHQAAQNGVGVAVYPLAFVSEHVETLVEIEIDYRKRAADLGISYFARVGTVSTQDDFINGLAELVINAEERIASPRTCPGECICSCEQPPRSGKEILNTGLYLIMEGEGKGEREIALTLKRSYPGMTEEEAAEHETLCRGILQEGERKSAALIEKKLGNDVEEFRYFSEHIRMTWSWISDRNLKKLHRHSFYCASDKPGKKEAL